MKEIIILFLLVVAQNASFTLVSRARNSNSLLYHLLASIGSNGIWLLVFRNMVVSINDVTLMWTYLIASVLGSIGMHYLAMKFFEKKKEVKQQILTVGRIVNYNDGQQLRAALISKVYNATCIDVCVFDHSSFQNTANAVLKFCSIIQGDGVGQWNWPEIKQ